MAILAKKGAFSAHGALPGLALIAALMQIALVIPGEFSRFWWNDFRYFWFAGALWNEGLSPYGAEYLARGREAFSTFSAPFYYPPAMRALVAPLALAPMKEAAAAFFFVNCVLLFATCGMLAKIYKSFAPANTAYLMTAFFLVIGFAVLRQPLINAAVGQYTVFFLFFFTVLLYGVRERNSAFIAIGLAILLIKPQFGAGLFVYCLLRREFRSAALKAGFIYAALTVWGMAPDFGGVLPSFLKNLAAYTEHPVNLPEASAGLNFLLAQINLELHATSWLALICVFAGAAALSPMSATPPLAPLLIMTWSLIAAPTHSTDLTMLLPCAGAIFLLRDKTMLLAAAFGFVIVGRSTEMINWLASGAARKLEFLTVANTIGLACILTCLLYLFFTQQNRMRHGENYERNDALAQR